MIRLATALVVIAICLAAALGGFEIVRFSAAVARDDGRGQVDALRPWFDVPGLSFDARVAVATIVDPDDPTSALRRRNDVTGLLAIRPMASEFWLSLAKMREETHQDAKSVLDALSMSVLTGPRESYIMVQRGVYGLYLWDRLPADMKARTISELAQNLKTWTFTPRDERIARSVLSDEPEETRAEVGTLLAAQGVPRERLARIGL